MVTFLLNGFISVPKYMKYQVSVDSGTRKMEGTKINESSLLLCLYIQSENDSGSSHLNFFHKLSL